MKEINQKIKKLLSLCKSNNVRCFISVENTPSSWNTKEDNIDDRFQNLLNQLSFDLKDISNNCADVCYKNTDGKWIINSLY